MQSIISLKLGLGSAIPKEAFQSATVCGRITWHTCLNQLRATSAGLAYYIELAEMAVAMRLLVIFLVWLPVKAAVADCKGDVAGDKIWMCPDVDVKQCPLTYASTGFSPEYIQCGVAGKSCVSLGPLCQPRK